MSSIAITPAQRRSRMQLILIALLFAAPVVTAWVTWKFVSNDGVASTTNAGELVRPARPLTAAPLQDLSGGSVDGSLHSGRWSYVILGGDGCDANCLERLRLTTLVRVSVNKDMSRVQRVLLVNKATPELAGLQAEHHDLVIAVAAGSAWQAYSGQFTAAGEAGIYLVDPLGNLMMYYAPSVPPKGVLQDLRKLLKVSQVG